MLVAASWQERNRWSKAPQGELRGRPGRQSAAVKHHPYRPTRDQAPTPEIIEAALGILDASGSERAPPALYWIVTGASAKKLLPELRFTPLDGWPAGVYAAVPLLGMRLIAASELPRTPAGTVLARAPGIAHSPPDLDQRLGLGDQDVARSV